MKKSSSDLPRVGRPLGSGAQLPAIARTRASRTDRAKQGAVRIETTLEKTTYDALLALMEHWGCTTKKEVVERAIHRNIRIFRRSASLSRFCRTPTGYCILCKIDRKIAAPTQCLIVFSPIRQFIFRLRDLFSATFIKFVGHWLFYGIVL